MQDDHGKDDDLLSDDGVHPGNEVVCAGTRSFGHDMPLIPNGGKLYILHTFIALERQCKV